MARAGARREGLAGLQTNLLLGFLQEEPHLAFQHIERVGDIRVEVPRHGLRRRELQLADVEALPRHVSGATLDLVEVAGVFDSLKAGADGHEKSLAPPRTTNKDNGSRCCY